MSYTDEEVGLIGYCDSLGYGGGIMTLERALQYLETTSRVSCPQITCDQAREIAELMRDLSDQHQVDIAEMVSWKIHAQVLHERDDALAKLREVEMDRRAEIDCGQPDVCAKPPGCQKHWAFKASALVRERDDAWTVVANVSDELSEARRDHEILRQTACGFAWDAGREMAEKEDKQWLYCVKCHQKTGLTLDRMCPPCANYREPTPVEAAPDFDADDYAKPGKR